MSRYLPLWNYLRENGKEEYLLSFEEIRNIAGFEIDHAFLRYKKESRDFGYETGKISLKNRTVIFRKI